MSAPKILGIFFFILLVGGMILGCAGQTPTPAENSASPTPQAEQVVKQEATAENVASAAKATDETPTQGTVDADPPLILMADELTTLDPYRMTTTRPAGSIASHIWDTLTQLNSDLQVEPHLAESWRLLNDLAWEFKLRQGITFYNGELLNAEAVRFSIERAQSMPGSTETFAKDVKLKEVKIVDDYTLHLITSSPITNLPYHLAFLEILPPIYYSETSLNRLAVAPVGSGPYRLDEWVQSKELVLEAVPTYWKGAPILPRLVFQTVPSAEDRLAALRLDQADLVTDLPPTRVDQWTSPGSRLVAIESTQRIFVGIHIEKGSPLADKRVRQALNYGVNVEQIISDLFQGYGEHYGSWVNPPSNNPKLAPWPYDPDLARDLLAEAGYQTGFTTTLQTPSGIYYQDVAIAEAIAQQLGEIGITVEVETVDWNTHTHRLLSGEAAPLFLLGLNSHGDGLEDVTNLSTNFAFNPTGWQNDSFEEVVRQAAGTFNEATRTRLLNEAQAIAYDEAPWIWLWRSYDFYGVRQGFDWTPRRDGLIYLYKAVDSKP